MIVDFKKTDPRVSVPEYKSNGAMCFDLSVFPDKTIDLYPGERLMLSSGLAFELPEGHGMKVYPRSSTGAKFGVQLANGTGIIDNDYRGTVYLTLTNLSDEPFTIRPGDRVCQAEVVPYVQPLFREVEELTMTVRGEGAFGSTGVGA